MTFDPDCDLDLGQGIPNIASHLAIKFYSQKFDEIHSSSFKSLKRHNVASDP